MVVWIAIGLLFAILASVGFRRLQKPPPQDPKWISVINNIEPVTNFDWTSCPPIPIRPFVNKKNFNPLMGVKQMTADKHDWLRVESTYLEEIRMKQQMCVHRPNDAMFASDTPKTALALAEFYEMVTRFMTQRYPELFVIKENLVHNKITDDSCPYFAKGQSNEKMMVNINKLMDEDFLILIKDNDDDEEFKLRVLVNAAPAGFDPKRGHNAPLSHIHSPVPQYGTRLQSPMAKFFANMLPKDLWVRTNWSIQTHANRFNLNALHGRDGDQIKQLLREELEVDATRLRVERQIFTRLPKSKGMIMIIRTYLTPISEIKAEGNGEELIRGIQSLPDDLAFYKRRPEWGNAVVEYLREK